jgi:hypothetical protein
MMGFGALISFVTFLNITYSAAVIVKDNEVNVLTTTGRLEGHVQQVRQSTTLKYSIHSTPF